MSWEIDGTHSHVMFSIRHVMVSVVRGRFNVMSGHMYIDEQHPELSWVDAQVDTASIDTQNEQRDVHLRGADFFEVDTFQLSLLRVHGLKLPATRTIRSLAISLSTA